MTQLELDVEISTAQDSDSFDCTQACGGRCLSYMRVDCTYCIYVYIYRVYVHICMYVYIYIHIHTAYVYYIYLIHITMILYMQHNI